MQLGQHLEKRKGDCETGNECTSANEIHRKVFLSAKEEKDKEEEDKEEEEDRKEWERKLHQQNHFRFTCIGPDHGFEKSRCNDLIAPSKIGLGFGLGLSERDQRIT